MNPGLWIKALRVIPRISKEEWEKLDLISKLLVSSRAAVVVMTFISAAIAGLLALRDGRFDLGRWLLLTIGLTFAHATNNLLNDLTDYSRGVDKDNYFRTQYGPQVLEQGLVTKKVLLSYVALTGGIALAAGIPLVLFGGTTALYLLLAGVAFVLFYTWPLKYIGLGEISVILVWGPLMIGGGYFVITGAWDWHVVIASLPFALGATTVIFGKHIDKLQEDKAKKIHTLPVILGEKAARYVAISMIVFQYLLVFYLVAVQYFSPVLLAVVLALYDAIRPIRIYLKPRPAQPPPDLPKGVWPMWFVAASFVHNRTFGMVFLIAMIVQLFL
ncbi:MAG: prenyltransferase [Anaerolineaceae bacterium]|nr:prenyltransferase [Anaerolineaceae bacterium]